MGALSSPRWTKERKSPERHAAAATRGATSKKTSKGADSAKVERGKSSSRFITKNTGKKIR